MTDFAAVGAAYADHSAGARGRLRHDLVERRLRAELPPTPVRILDAGCGAGEMTLRLAAAGHRVTGADPSPRMPAAAADRLAERPELRDRVRLVEAGVEDLPFAEGEFDAVCCHGVLMYLAEPGTAIARLSELVAPGGLLSVLAKNRRAIGVREALTGDHGAARRLIESDAAASPGRLGLETRGDTAEDLDRLAAGHGLTPLRRQGVRIFTDHPEDWAPDRDAYAAAVELEWAVSWRSPMRDMAHLVHTLARRPREGRRDPHRCPSA
ncbi:methyltransferase domain-containing protein [Streptomyces sp. NPDC035033]|uniref:methyltransferase domain-containing protein n=1 Tax=Streptomyces sp. NPDC035033 TaxID=3155368 RepID=UPI00340B42C4